MRGDGLALAVAVLAITVRLAFVPGTPVLLTGDSETYLGPALDLSRGSGFELSLKRTPGYPLLAAASFRLLGEELSPLALLQHGLGVLTAVLTFLLGRELAGWKVGLLAGLAAAVAGNLLIYERLMMTETLFTAAVVGTALAAVRASTSERAGWAVLAGVSVALATLVRPVAQPLLALVPLGLLLMRCSWRRLAVLTGAVVLGYALILAPWTLARRASSDSSELGALGQTLVGRIARHDRGGFTVYDPTLDQSQQDPARLRARQIVQEAVDRGTSGRAVFTRLRKELGLGEAQTDRLMRDLALEAIRRDPGYYISGTLQRFVRLWATPPERLRAQVGNQRTVRDGYEDVDTLPLVQRAAAPDGLDVSFQEQLAGLFQPGAWGPTLAITFLLGCTLGVWSGWRGCQVGAPHNADAASAGHPALRALVLLPAAATLGLVALSAALVGGVPRYRYPEDPLIYVVGFAGIAWALSGLGRRTRPRPAR
ncbi:MAG: glycosyltransferase family 39 protein [Chloroflexi bacterium]|nr:glycosyltransferase family 39 protein [Chloroflexota bacterium]